MTLPPMLARVAAVFPHPLIFATVSGAPSRSYSVRSQRHHAATPAITPPRCASADTDP
jgi:hypothetical protein